MRSFRAATVTMTLSLKRLLAPTVVMAAFPQDVLSTNCHLFGR
jgi:hypothetical protein